MAIPLPVRLPYRDVGYVAALGLDLDQTVGLFLLGALAFGVLATGLVVPALGLLALVSGALAYELVWTPATGFGELGGHTVIGIDADPYLWRYLRTWFVWAPILLAGGVAEFGIRAGYGIGDGRLRNLPAFPLSGEQIAVAAGGCALLFGLATDAVMVEMGTQASYQKWWGLAGSFLIVVIALGGLLYRGLLVPVVLASLVISRERGTS